MKESKRTAPALGNRCHPIEIRQGVEVSMRQIGTVMRMIQALPFLGGKMVSTDNILILSSHLRLGLPKGLFLSGFSTKILHAFLEGSMQYIVSI